MLLHLYLPCLMVSCLVLQVSTIDNAVSECNIWHQLFSHLSNSSDHLPAVPPVNCDGTCTQLNCSSHVNFSPWLSKRTLQEFDVCFGLRLNHCDSPVNLDYFLYAPDANISLNGSVSHNYTIEIPVQNGLLTATVVVTIELVNANSSHILLKVSIKVKDGFPLSQFFKQRILQTYIDVPSCTDADKKKLKAPFLAPSVCDFYKGSTGMPKSLTALLSASIVTPKSSTDVMKSKTFNNACEVGLFECSTNEMCTHIDDSSLSRNGLCQCVPSATLSAETGLCETMTTPLKLTQANESKQQDVTSKRTSIIIAVVVGGLILILVIWGVIIYIGRHKRLAIYKDRHRLLTEDDDEDTATNLTI